MSEMAIEAQASDKAFGIWAPALMPLDPDLRPDGARAIEHLHWLLETGCHGIALFGTTSEATSFSVAERMAILDQVLAAGIPGDSLMVGSGCCALTDTLDLTRQATRAGCSVLMLPPFYYKDVSDEGLYAAYAEVIERLGEADLKIYFYHFPKLSCVPITHAVIERLLKAYPTVIKGLKDSSGDAAGCAAYIDAFPEMAIFPGTESLLLDMLEVGGAGSITASANVNAGAIRRVYDAWAAGGADAAELQAKISGLRQILQAYPLIPVLKQIVAWERDDDAWLRLRPPLAPLAADQAAALKQALDQAGFTLGGL
jgi:4-hydroxy-tetrahydrodipicolinate synthase